MEGYSATIVRASKDLTAREKIMFKDTTNAISLDEATQEKSIVIAPVAWAVIAVHNEASDSKDYEKIVIMDDKGDKYVTGSVSFREAFSDIDTDMRADGEDYCIMVYRRESKNYKGKSFITCSLV